MSPSLTLFFQFQPPPSHPSNRKMPLREVLAESDRLDSFQTTVRQGADQSEVVASLKFDKNAEGSITFTSSEAVLNVSHQKNKGTWKMSSDTIPNLMLATRRRSNVFELRVGENLFLLKPDGSDISNYKVFRVTEEGSIVALSATGHIICEIKKDSADTHAHWVQFDGELGMRLPMFCLWLVSVANMHASGLIHLRRPRLRLRLKKSHFKNAAYPAVELAAVTAAMAL